MKIPKPSPSKSWELSGPQGWLSGAVALVLWGCSSTGIVHETTYVDGMETDSATVQETPNGGYQTLSGDPFVVINNQVEPESMLPYGGGEEGLRLAQDE